MERKFWEEAWLSSSPGFHQTRVNPHLVRFLPRKISGKVLVPLCGKSLDLIWLSQNGWEVVGVELVERACEAFFQENNLEVTKTRQGEFTVYRAGKITVWCGDFFKLPKQAIEGVNAVYDRAALIALPLETRKQYAKKMEELLADAPRDLTYLLLALEYQQGAMSGPPFSVGAEEIQALFSKAFQVNPCLREDGNSSRSINTALSQIPGLVMTAYQLSFSSRT